jgi:hypothetical protein
MRDQQMTVFVGARLPEELVRQLRDLGEGNVSAGIRRMAEMFNMRTTQVRGGVKQSGDVKQSAASDVKQSVGADVKQRRAVKHQEPVAPSVPSAMPKARPAAPIGSAERQRALASIRATQRPKSITAWSDGDDEPEADPADHSGRQPGAPEADEEDW